MMSWLLPLDIGLILGLLFAWPVLSLAISFRLLGFPDLTIEGSVPIGAAVLAVSVHNGQSAWVALLLAAAAGGILGLLTAAIHAYLRVNKFLAGILVVAISYTLVLRIMGAPNIGLFGQPTVFDAIASLNTRGPDIQLGTLLFLLVLLSLTVAVLSRLATSTWGLRLRVASSNPDYGHAIGLASRRWLIAGLAFTNGLAAIGGAFIAMYQGFADVSMGQGTLVLALASITIGERLTPQRYFTIATYVMLAATMGSMVYQVLVAYAVRAGMAATDLKFVTALFVLAVIGLRLRHKDDEFLEALS